MLHMHAFLQSHVIVQPSVTVCVSRNIHIDKGFKQFLWTNRINRQTESSQSTVFSGNSDLFHDVPKQPNKFSRPK